MSSPEGAWPLFKFKAETSPLILTFLSLLLSSMSPTPERPCVPET